jgi:phosphatidylserine/phosphatidylglycerophosphate/cardiolipin synthase-like enzyme
MINFGSYNWAKSAEQSHFESMMFEDEKQRVDFYKRMFDFLLEYSVGVDEAEDHPWARERPAHGPIDEDLAIEHNGERFPRQAFSPEGLIEDSILRAIRAADRTIDIAMFSFYSARIAEELLIAKRRGVAVRLVLDRMQSKLMKLDNWFAYYGFDVKILGGPNPFGNVFWEKNHNKFMIVDGKLLETGSYNYTKNAEENSYENANFYYDNPDVAFYLAYFEMLHRTGWRPLTPKAPPDGLPAPEDFFSPERREAALAEAAEY